MNRSSNNHATKNFQKSYLVLSVQSFLNGPLLAQPESVDEPSSSEGNSDFVAVSFRSILQGTRLPTTFLFVAAFIRFFFPFSFEEGSKTPSRSIIELIASSASLLGENGTVIIFRGTLSGVRINNARHNGHFTDSCQPPQPR